jgi:hypothetical protein
MALGVPSQSLTSARLDSPNLIFNQTILLSLGGSMMALCAVLKSIHFSQGMSAIFPTRKGV